MRYFKIEELGDLRNIKALATIDEEPQGLKLKSWYLTHGKPVQTLYQKIYQDNLKINLEKNAKDGSLADFISNTACLLIFSERCKKVFQEFLSEEDVEYLPLDIYDASDVFISGDYWLIQPLNTHDVLDRQACEISYDNLEPEKPVGVIGDYFFSEEKVNTAPALFRIPEYPSDFFIREDLARALYELHPSNVFLTEITVL